MTDPIAPPSAPAPQPAVRPTAAPARVFGASDRTGVWFTRVWGLVLVVVGLWLFASVTLGYDLPAFDWRLAWPLILIGVGLFIIGSAVARRR